MKNFTVNVGGQSMTLPGPDDATQEQAQAEAERQQQAKNAAGIDKDFTGPAHLLGHAALGAADLIAGPARLMGYEPGPRYQQAEKEPSTTGDKIARFVGGTLPLAPIGPAGVGVSRGVGAVEGASAPADSPAQRVVNTGLGALAGGFGRAAPGSSAIDRLIGGGLGMLAGHGLGGPESMFSTYFGGKLGSQLGPEVHGAVANYLRQFPPSVVARAVALLGDPVTKMLVDQYNAMNERSTPTGTSQQ